MEVRLLGPVEVWAASRPVDAGSPRQRCVLAALAADAGRPVSTETLIDRVWGHAPPAQVRQTLYVYITRIRTMLNRACPEGGVRLLHRSGGYLLDLDVERVDLLRFRRSVEVARGPGCDDAERATLLGQALDLWRGVPLADLTGEWPTRVGQTWQRHRLDAVVLWAQTRLRLGEAAAVVGPLTDLVAEHPLAESLVEVLMRALSAVGRPAEALDLYAETKRELADELGTDPHSGLRRLHLEILRGGNGHQPPTPTPPHRPAPAHLPPDVRGFAGREEPLARLDRVLAAAGEQPTAVVISAVSGTAGVGKTTLAVHWAHRVAGQFPDGQLYVNLRGFDPSGTAMSPAEAVRGFLDALGVPAQGIPQTLDGQVGLYRSLLSGQRMLVVLDNARDAGQVRPLLPAAPGCVAVVTSRNQLPGLVAVEGAHAVNLDLLSTGEARQLLAQRLGEQAVRAEPDAVDEIITRCARLPLALAVVCARATTDPDSALTTVAEELRAAQGGLAAFDARDPASDVRTVFSWSYRTLSPDAARLFRLLGLHPGPDISGPAAASLIARPPAGIRRLLAELTRAHLLAERPPGRYACHDLLRAYATELAHAMDSDTDRHEATHRLLDHYLHTGYTAALLMLPHRNKIQLSPARPGVTPEHLADRDQATAWYSAEHSVLVRAIDQAAATGFDTHAWQLAWTLAHYFERRGHWHDWATANRTGLLAAQRSGDRVGQAHIHRELGRAYARSDRCDDAVLHLRAAADLFASLGDQVGLAHIHDGYAFVYGQQQGDHRATLRHGLRALDLYRAAGHREGEANALNNIGYAYAGLGDYRQAITYCERAISAQQAVGYRLGEAAAWDSLGHSHHLLGNLRQSIECYRRSVELYSEADDRYDLGRCRRELGNVYAEAGDRDAARDAWQQALHVLDELGHPDAGGVREKLAGLAGGR